MSEANNSMYVDLYVVDSMDPGYWIKSGTGQAGMTGVGICSAEIFKHRNESLFFVFFVPFVVKKSFEVDCCDLHTG